MTAKPKLNIPVPAVWVAVVALCLLAVLLVSLTRTGTELVEPEILSSSPQGQHLQMPSTPKGSWQKQYVVPHSATRDQVLQRLSEISARYQQLRPAIRVSAEPGLHSRESVAREVANALAQYNLGQLDYGVEPPASTAQLQGAVILRCAEKDQRIARELLGALAPYLSGGVFLMFDDATAVHRMQLYLIGTPWFDKNGLVTFDPQIPQEEPYEK